MIEARKQKLNKYDINFSEFKNYTGISSFEVPKKLKRFYGSTITSEDCFYLIANVVFDQCDLLTGQKASFLEQENFSEWAKRVGEKRADNFKAAVFEEVKFRIFSNAFPEFANETSLQNPVFSITGERKEYKIISQILSPQAANYIISSHWNIVDFEGAQDYINNFEQYLDKFVYKPFYKDLGALRALMIAKEMSLQTRIGEVSNLVAHHYAEFIFTKQIQEKFNKDIKEKVVDLTALIDAKELAILMKILELKNNTEGVLQQLKANDTLHSEQITDLYEKDKSVNKKIETLELENQTQQTQLSSLEIKQNEMSKKIDKLEIDGTDFSNAAELTDEAVVKLSEVENEVKAVKNNLILHTNIFNEQQAAQDKKISNLDESLSSFKNEINTKFESINNTGTSAGTGTTTTTLPKNVLTEDNLNSKARELSALTVTPGNGTHNSSIFLKNNKANWEFYADSNNGSFGVWDKLKNREVFNISTERKVDFYNEINLHNNKIINLAEPTTSKEAATKNYVDSIKTTLENNLRTANEKISTLENNSTAWNEKPTKEYVDNINTSLTNDLSELKNKITEISKSSGVGEGESTEKKFQLIQIDLIRINKRLEWLERTHNYTSESYKSNKKTLLNNGMKIHNTRSVEETIKNAKLGQAAEVIMKITYTDTSWPSSTLISTATKDITWEWNFTPDDEYIYEFELYGLDKNNKNSEYYKVQLTISKSLDEVKVRQVDFRHIKTGSSLVGGRIDLDILYL